MNDPRSQLAPLPPGRLRAPRDLAPYIDHTLLKPEATAEEVVALCRVALQHGFASVCVNSSWVATAAQVLGNGPTVPIAVVGFPLGAALSAAKAFETREAVKAGAREVDMVLNLGALKGRDHALVARDIALVVEAAGAAPVKVILETALLSDEEKVVACALAKASGARWVKTSTGFGGGGATVADVTLMRRVVGDDVGVKASGGVRTTEEAMALVAAGASRLGASASVAIVGGAAAGPSGY